MNAPPRDDDRAVWAVRHLRSGWLHAVPSASAGFVVVASRCQSVASRMTRTQAAALAAAYWAVTGDKDLTVERVGE